MNDPHLTSDAALKERHMLVSFPSSAKERTKVMLGFLDAAKAQWDLTADIVCPRIDRPGFEALTLPSGQFFITPHFLQRAEWESDPAEVAAAEQRFHEAERAAGLPAGRVVMGAAHTVGRAFTAPVRMIRSYPLVRQILKDNSQPFHIILRLFRFADKVLAESDPDFVCTYEFATPLNASLWFAANLRGIPCLCIRYSKMNSGRAFWTLDREMLNTLAIERGVEKRKSDAAPRSAGGEAVQKFRNRPATVDYIASKWHSRAKHGFFIWHLRSARIVCREFLNRLSGHDQALVEPPQSRLTRYYRSRFLEISQQLYLRSYDEVALAKMKYVYFPLHKEGELALALQATQWYDQRNTIRVLASMLPFGYTLLVRENILNSGNCPMHIYRELSRIPNVVLADPLDPQFKYLQHADLVVTENGSSGWEGLLLARRVLLLSKTFYDGAGLGVSISKPDRLNAAILEALAKPAVADPAAHDHALACAIDAEQETTFPFGPSTESSVLDRLAETIVPVLRQRAASGPLGATENVPDGEKLAASL